MTRRKRHNLLIVIACLAGAAVAVWALWRTDSLRLEAGTPYSSAMAALRRSGASEFACSYRYFFPPDKPRPFFRYAWYTLRNGMSIEVNGDRKTNGEQLRLTSIEVCNSTILFCCKGETWYKLQAAGIDGERSVLTGLVRRSQDDGDAEEDQCSFIYKGMSTPDAEAALEAVGAREARLADELKNTLADRDNWRQYGLGGRHILLHCGTPDGDAPVLREIVVSAQKPASGGSAAADYWIEFEVLDLQRPLGERWHCAFDDKCAWRPGGQHSRDWLRRSGQRR